MYSTVCSETSSSKTKQKKLWLVQHKPSYKEDSSCIELNAMVLYPNSPLLCVALHWLTLN